jgi:hypothetical protein
MSHTSPPSVLKSLRQLQVAFWGRRVAHWLIRAAWLGLLVPTAFMAGYLWAGWEVHWQDWAIPMLLLSSLSVLWSMRPLTLWRIVRRLDRRLELQARLITALEISHGPNVSAYPDDNPVVEHLLQETVQIITLLRQKVRLLNRTFWLEMQALIAVAALLAALLMLDTFTPIVPTTAPLELPSTWQEPTADEVISSNPNLAQSIAPEEVNTEPFTNEDLQTALQILAKVLRSHAVTHSIAEAIDQGELDRAAEGLRRLADQLDDLSEQARAELGGLLQEAADKIGNMAPSLTEPLQAGSNALANDDLLEAGQALEELAKVLEEIEDDPAEVAESRPVEEQPIVPEQSAEMEQEQLAPQDETIDDNPTENDVEQDEPPDDESLDVEGDPMELESDPELEERVVQAADPEAEASEAQTQDAPFTRQPLDAPSQELGPDPLTYPWEKREVIRRYFTP